MSDVKPDISNKWVQIGGELVNHGEDGYIADPIKYQNISTGEIADAAPDGAELLKAVGGTHEEKNNTGGTMYQDADGNYYSARMEGYAPGAQDWQRNVPQLLTDLTPDQIKTSMQGYDTAQKEATAHFNSSFTGLGTFGDILFIGAIGAGALAAGGAFATGAGAVDATSAALASNIGGASGLGMTAAEATASGLGADAIASGVTSAAAPAATEATSSLPKIVMDAGKGALKGAAVSGLTGGDPIKGALTGAVAGGLADQFGGGTVGQIATGVGTGLIAKALTKDKSTLAAGTVAATDPNAAAKTFGTFGSLILPSVFKAGIGPDFRGASTG